MIGLKRHTVRVTDHDPEWLTLAGKACLQVRQAAADLLLDIQHVGSTAVPGLRAKPILDLVAGITSPESVPCLVQRLTEIGYIYRGDGGNEGGHLFVWESRPHVRTIHLHIVRYNGVQWRNYLRFRDLLRQRSDIRTQYATLKLELKDAFPNDRKRYTDSKHDFIRGVLGG